MLVHSLKLLRSNVRQSQILLKKANISTTFQLWKDQEVISYEELTQKLSNKEVTLVDVRSFEEAEGTGIVPGAMVVPLHELGDVISLPPPLFEEETGHSKPSPSTPVVTMCRSGVRAKTAHMALLGAGYQNVRVYRGSFMEWVEKDGELQSFFH